MNMNDNNFIRENTNPNCSNAAQQPPLIQIQEAQDCDMMSSYSNMQEQISTQINRKLLHPKKRFVSQFSIATAKGSQPIGQDLRAYVEEKKNNSYEQPCAEKGGCDYDTFMDCEPMDCGPMDCD